MSAAATAAPAYVLHIYPTNLYFRLLLLTLFNSDGSLVLRPLSPRSPLLPLQILPPRRLLFPQYLLLRLVRCDLSRSAFYPADVEENANAGEVGD